MLKKICLFIFSITLSNMAAAEYIGAKVPLESAALPKIKFIINNQLTNTVKTKLELSDFYDDAQKMDSNPNIDLAHSTCTDTIFSTANVNICKTIGSPYEGSITAYPPVMPAPHGLLDALVFKKRKFEGIIQLYDSSNNIIANVTFKLKLNPSKTWGYIYNDYLQWEPLSPQVLDDNVLVEATISEALFDWCYATSDTNDLKWCSRTVTIKLSPKN